MKEIIYSIGKREYLITSIAVSISFFLLLGYRFFQLEYISSVVEIICYIAVFVFWIIWTIKKTRIVKGIIYIVLLIMILGYIVSGEGTTLLFKIGNARTYKFSPNYQNTLIIEKSNFLHFRIDYYKWEGILFKKLLHKGEIEWRDILEIKVIWLEEHKVRVLQGSIRYEFDFGFEKDR